MVKPVEQAKLEPPPEKAFKARQLNLFQNFLCNTQAERTRYSNTIELWDAVPKYCISRRRQSKMRTSEGFLPVAEIKFKFKGQELIVRINPALFIVDSDNISFYPAGREELVEDALRKMACQPGQGYLDNDRSGVMFTLHELRLELKKNGHTLSFYQVVNALEILAKTSIEIAPLNGKAMYVTSPLTTLAGVSKEDLKDDPSSRWYADFSSLVSEGIQLAKYRQYDYRLNMRLKSQLARYLHKRMSHNYVQASMLTPYTITMQGIARDSGLLGQSRANNNRRKLEKALDELKANEVIMHYEAEETRGLRNALVDIQYTITSHRSFVGEVKKANKRLALIEGNQEVNR